MKVLFLMELEGLKGRDKIAGYDVESVIKYPGKYLFGLLYYIKQPF